MDPELNAIDDLLPGPAWNSKVGNQSHNWHCKKPGESECVRFRTNEKEAVRTERMRIKTDDERREKWRGDVKHNDKDWKRCADNELGDCDYKDREIQR